MKGDDTIGKYYDIEKVLDSIDILDFLRDHAGMEFKKEGINRYVWKEHDSFVVIPYGVNASWHWNSRDIHGRNALDYLIKVEGLEFKDAMEVLTQGRYEMSDQKKADKEVKDVSADQSKREKRIRIPPKAHKNRESLFYLSEERGLDAKIIFDLIERDRIYTDRDHNCVFVNFDAQGKVSFVQKRSVNEKRMRSFGSADKGGYGFSIDGRQKDTVYVYEAPIDMLSHANMYAIEKDDMSSWDDRSMIALCGVGMYKALDYYLEHHTDVKNIVLCLDNDEAGMLHTVKYIVRYSDRGYKMTYMTPKNKDFNEDLLMMRKNMTRERGEQIYEVFKKDDKETEKEDKKYEKSGKSRMVLPL